MSQQIDQDILKALEAGFGPEEILGAYKKSADPEHQTWYNNYLQGMREGPKQSERMTQFVEQGKKEQETEREKFTKEMQGGFDVPSWIKTPEGLTAAGATLYGGFKVGQGVADKLIDIAPKGFKSITERLINKTAEIDRTVDVPMGTPVQPNPVQQAQQKVVDIKNALAAKGPAPAPQAPVQGIQPPVTPTVTEAVALGESPTKAIQADLAPLVDEAGTKPKLNRTREEMAAAYAASNEYPTETKPVSEEKTVQARVKRSKEQIAADKLAAEASAPPGFRANYKKSTQEPIGPGAYNWIYGQEGANAPAVWNALFGERNIPYSMDPNSELQRKYAEYKFSVAEPGTQLNELPRTAGGGVNKTPKHIPNYIKGGATPGSLGGLAAMAALLGFGSTEKAQAAMAKAAGAIKDIGISPDIFAGKGEELGRLGQGYVTAGNPNYVRELSAQLAAERDPERKAILQNEIRKAGGVAPAMR
jgi:hypothetical protein